MLRRAFIITVGLVGAAAALVHAVPAEAGEAVRAERHMIAAANPLAAQAGLDILRQGGSAVDAAIAAQMVLNLVEPQSSGHRRRRFHADLQCRRRHGARL